jgi:hypothetical protein
MTMETQQRYEAPVAEVVILHTEGIICESGVQSTIPGYEDAIEI